jgi:hypothetical protein
MIRFFSVLLVTSALTAGAYAQTPEPTTAPAGQYDDIRQAFTTAENAIDELDQDIDHAQGGADVAQAITKFTATMMTVKKAAMDMQKKYPELAANGGQPPAELADSFAKLRASVEKLATIMPKAARYQDDPAVKDALQKMQSSMSATDQTDAN